MIDIYDDRYLRSRALDHRQVVHWSGAAGDSAIAIVEAADMMLAAETNDLLRSVGHSIPDRSLARAVVDGKREVGGAGVALGELGVFGMTVSERNGGTGLGLADQCAVVEYLGGRVAPLPILSVGLAAHVLDRGYGAPAAGLLDHLLAGATDVGVVLAADGRADLAMSSSGERTFSTAASNTRSTLLG